MEMADEPRPEREGRATRKRRLVLSGAGIMLIMIGTAGTIIAIVPQIEALLLALAGRGYIYLAIGVVGGLFLYFGRRRTPKGGVTSTSVT